METRVIEVFGELGPTHRLIPLRSRGELVGLLALRSENPDTFAQSRFGIVSEVTNSLAIVIIQKRLLEQVRSANQSLQNLSRYLVNIQEQERRSLARELHDEIGQALTAVKMSLDSLAKLPVADNQSHLQESIQIVSQTLQQVRNMSLSLRPALLDELGLSATLRWYVDRLAQWNNIDAQFQASLTQERMPPEIETTLFRVAQEALTNAIRHAEANRVAVVLTQTDEHIILQIRDNGRGFFVEKAIQNAVRGASLGLLSMQERLHLVGGELNIHSTPGLGTEIAAKVPLIVWLTQNAVEGDHAS
jgi:signal transduction histidine kinase